MFVAAGLSILPLAGWMGTATEEIASVAGSLWGGLLNATFGNATELIVAVFALRAGLVDVVKASITGSMIGNLLLVMGLAMFLGGLRHKEQTFQPTIARVNASAMTLAAIAILVPTAVDTTSDGLALEVMQHLSVAVALVLIGVYAMTLLFSMRTHSYLYDLKGDGGRDSRERSEVESAETEEEDSHTANVGLWIGVLLACTIAVAIESELLVSSLEAATAQLGLTALFTGVIVLPIIGNAAEHATAVSVAMKNKMELSISVAVGSTLQIALFVGPVLVLLGQWMGQPMNLDFNPFELVAVAVAVAIANSISTDGRSNWLEGILLLATYAVLGISFYFHPVIEGIG
ncbi:calcium/proton exchanger [Synechococcus sp. PCC 7336]|uniref:calcium/proton exchanger n=1 Tax=Synechococcus sp. PCC 7336 TaxID=195250 RepID=UPI0003454B99